MPNVKAFSAASPTAPLAADTITRREPGARDVQIEILFCGICHSDVHYARNEWNDTLPAVYPAVPGHEILGRVTRVGADVRKVKPGDIVGVGCMVGSDRDCPQCRRDMEQFCPNMVGTYGGTETQTGKPTYGGYSESIVVDEHFVLKIPASLRHDAAAPLLCAGITTYSPLRHWGVGKGKNVGIVGIGGLGHMGVKFAHALGARTVVFTTSPSKKEDALRLGADAVVLSTDANQMEKHAGSFDFILDCVAAAHDLNTYLRMLAPDGTLTMLGAPPQPLPVGIFNLLMGRKALAGSLIGGIKETQEMLDFCGQHNITCDVEVIAMQQVNEAYARMLKSDVKYRFSIDMASLKS